MYAKEITFVVNIIYDKQNKMHSKNDRLTEQNTCRPVLIFLFMNIHLDY